MSTCEKKPTSTMASEESRTHLSYTGDVVVHERNEQILHPGRIKGIAAAPFFAAERRKFHPDAIHDLDHGLWDAVHHRIEGSHTANVEHDFGLAPALKR